MLASTISKTDHGARGLRRHIYADVVQPHVPVLLRQVLTNIFGAILLPEVICLLHPLSQVNRVEKAQNLPTPRIERVRR